MFRHAKRPLVGLALLLISACGGLPEAPEWDVKVAAPVSTDRLGVEDFLPAGIGTIERAGETLFTLPATRGEATLQMSAICPGCPTQSTSLIPEFTHGQIVSIAMPDDVVQMELRSGEAVIFATNGLGFTLLGDTGDGSGFLEAVVYDPESGTELGRERVSGPGTEFAPGETRELRIALAPGTITGGVNIELMVGSPQLILSTPIILGPDSDLTIEGAIQSLEVASVTVRVDAVELTQTSPMDLDLDSSTEGLIHDRLLGADVDFELIHDLAIDGPVRVSIANSPAALFSGDPQTEVSVGQFSFVAGQTQKASLDAAAVQQLIDFQEHWIGYSAVGTGTLGIPADQGPLSRFTPASGIDTRIRVTASFRVGG